jgi:hypothetical protein
VEDEAAYERSIDEETCTQLSGKQLVFNQKVSPAEALPHSRASCTQRLPY